MAAAAPHAMPILPIDCSAPVRRRVHEPMREPRCTSGPYWPTDAPAPRERHAAIADTTPLRTGMSASAVCAARMASGGPWNWRSWSSNRSRPTSRPAIVGVAIASKVSRRLLGAKSRASFRASTASTKPTATTATMPPITRPSTASMVMRVNNRRAGFRTCPRLCRPERRSSLPFCLSRICGYSGGSFSCHRSRSK